MPQIGDYVKFKFGTLDDYNSLNGNYEESTVYVLIDVGRIMIGGKSYSGDSTFDYAGHLSSASDLPTDLSSYANKVYSVGDSYTLYRCNGVDGWNRLSAADSELSDDSDNSIQNKVVKVALDKKLDTSGGTMTGSINMNGQRVLNLPTPSNDSDAATKKYVDDLSVRITVDDALSDTSTNPVQNKVIKKALDSKVDSTGGTISGSLKVVGALTTEENGEVTDFATKKYVDSKTVVDDNLSTVSQNPVQNKVVAGALNDKISKSAGGTITGDLKVAGRLTSTTPQSPAEVATKEYVDNRTGGATIQADYSTSDPNDASYIKNKPDLKSVATSGSYNDLADTPDLKPVATSGSYSDLTGLPDLTVDDQLDSESTNPVQNKVIVNALGDKVNTSEISGMVKRQITYVDSLPAVGSSGTGLKSLDPSNPNLTRAAYTNYQYSSALSTYYLRFNLEIRPLIVKLPGEPGEVRYQLINGLRTEMDPDSLEVEKIRLYLVNSDGSKEDLYQTLKTHKDNDASDDTLTWTVSYEVVRDTVVDADGSQVSADLYKYKLYCYYGSLLTTSASQTFFNNLNTRIRNATSFGAYVKYNFGSEEVTSSYNDSV